MNVLKVMRHAVLATLAATLLCSCAAIDRIKTTVPIWKREFHPDGTSEWVVPAG